MWGRPEYHPDAWAVLSPANWRSNPSIAIFATLEATLAVAAVALWRRGDGFWPAVALFACLVAAGAVPGFWSLPMLGKVQFPWRALTVAEFAIATAFARWLADPARSARAAYLLLPALMLGLAIVAPPYVAGHPTLAELDRTRPEVPEYLPAGTPFRTSAEAEALAATTPDRATSDGWTVHRRFWFPDVVVRCGDRTIASFAQPGTGLVVHRAVAGCTPVLATRATAPERIGWLLSALALLAILWLGLFPSAAGRRPPEVPAQ